jgi:hypothetical protein
MDTTRIEMSFVRSLISLLLMPIAMTCAVQAEVEIARSSKARAVIVQADSASEKEKIALQDLKKVLDQVTGAELALVGEDQASAESPAGKSKIFVGDCRFTQQFADGEALGTDEIVIKTVGNDLILTGDKPRGTVYAIYTFLQETIGCRWWAPGATSIPHRPDLKVQTLNIRYRSPFEARFILGEIGMLHEARSWHRLSFDLSFDFTPRGIPSRILPADKHYIQHPQWFAYLRDDGDEDKEDSYLYILKTWKHNAIHEPKPNPYDEYVEVLERTRRVHHQPCPNSEGVRQAITRAVLAELARDHAAWVAPKIVWVNQGHGHFICQCDACEAVREREGADSANWLLMVNEIAEKVEPKYPDVLVGTFAWLHTEAPPKTIKPRKNVLIYYSLHARNHRDPVPTYPFPSNAMKQWSSMAKVYAWDFDAGGRNCVQPFPNYFVNGENVQFFRSIGVDGVMVSGGYGKAADLAAMRTWVTAQMLWNPDQDPRALTIEFVNGYYGAAGPYLMEYMDAMVDAAHRKKDLWLGSYEFTTSAWATVRDMNTATRLFNEAAEAVKHDEVRSQRVWLARQSIDLSWLDRYDEFQQEARTRGIPFLGPPDPAKVVDAVAPYRVAWGQWHIGKSFSAYFDEIRKKFPARGQ